MISRLFGLLAICLSLMMPGGASAQMTQDVPLTPELIQGFIASYPSIQTKAKELGQEEAADSAGSLANWTAWIGASGVKAELDAVVSPHGFAGIENWVQAFSSIARAYTFAAEGQAIDTQMSEALAKIQADPNIPDDQKQMMLQQMQASAAAIAGMRPAQENIDAVQPYIAELKAVFDAN